MMAEWLDALRRARNGDGGWGTRAGLPSNTECTALSAVAVVRAGEPNESAAAVAWLRAHQADDGSWPIVDGAPSGSWCTSLAVIAAGAHEAASETTARGVRWLLREEGRTPTWRDRLRAWFGGGAETGMDLQLKGWPWAPNTFSWVEPTAYALVALGRFASSDAAADRIDEGRRMILDRTCPEGGWNYGNARVLGEELHAYPDTTALGLIGLQGAPRTDAIRQSIAALDRMMADYHSGLTLALAAISNRVLRRDAADLLARLERSWSENAFLEETRTTALAVLAAVPDPHPFSVASDA